MASSKTTKPVEKDELNLDEKVTVSNIADWGVGFARFDGVGDVNIAPGGKTRLSRNEIIAQVQRGNRLFTGTDGEGSHATLYIDDAPTRVEVGFESEDGKSKQHVMCEEMVSKAFSIKKQSDFEEYIRQEVVTRAEKFAIMKIVKDLGMNDYAKIKFIENHTGYTMQ